MIFIIGSPFFFILVSVVFLLILAAIEYEKPGLASLSLLATFWCLGYWGDFNVISAARLYPVQAVFALVGYFLIGVLWTVGKWWFFVTGRRAKYDELKAQYIEEKLNLPRDSHRIPDDKKADLQTFIQRKGSYYGGDITVRPKAREHKSRIMTWLTYWPWSMFWTLLSDPVKRIWKWSYDRLQTIFESISSRAYRGTEEDMPVVKATTNPYDRDRIPPL